MVETTAGRSFYEKERAENCRDSSNAEREKMGVFDLASRFLKERCKGMLSEALQ